MTKAYVLYKDASGNLEPKNAEVKGTTVKLKKFMRKEGEAVIVSEERAVRWKGRPAWIVPDGKGEAANPDRPNDTKSLISAEVADELNENNYVRQALQALRDAAQTTKKSDWLLVGLLVLNVLVTFWAMNEIKDVAEAMFRHLSTVHPLPTTQGAP